MPAMPTRDPQANNPFFEIGLSVFVVRILVRYGSDNFGKFLCMYRRALTSAVHPDVSQTPSETAALVNSAFDKLAALDVQSLVTLAGEYSGEDLEVTTDQYRRGFKAGLQRASEIDKANHDLRAENKSLRCRLLRLEQLCNLPTVTITKWETIRQQNSHRK